MKRFLLDKEQLLRYRRDSLQFSEYIYIIEPEFSPYMWVFLEKKKKKRRFELSIADVAIHDSKMQHSPFFSQLAEWVLWIWRRENVCERGYLFLLLSSFRSDKKWNNLKLMRGIGEVGMARVEGSGQGRVLDIRMGMEPVASFFFWGGGVGKGRESLDGKIVTN